MKKKDLPLSFEAAANADEALKKSFAKRRSRRGCFIDLVELDGSFLTDDPERVYVTVPVGERLDLAPDGRPGLLKLGVFLPDGTKVGDLPHRASAIPLALINKSVGVRAFLEAKSLDEGVLRLVVSLYCENY